MVSSATKRRSNEHYGASHLSRAADPRLCLMLSLFSSRVGPATHRHTVGGLETTRNRELGPGR